MQDETRPETVPSAVAATLRAIRRRERGIAILSGLLRVLAVVAAAALAAMVLDLAAGWRNAVARYMATVGVVGLGLGASWYWGWRPLARARSLLAAARELDRRVPGAEERWSTLAELGQSPDRPEVRGSEALIRQVGREAESAGATIVPSQVVPATALKAAIGGFLAVMAAWAVFAGLDGERAGILWQRLWQPGRPVSLTRVTSEPGESWVPRGEPVTLTARIEGRLPNQPAELVLRGTNASERALPMPRTGTNAAVFARVIEEVGDSFDYRVRAGDGQTPWHRVTAADRPRIREVRLRVQPPSYSGRPAEEKTELPGLVRVLEGSEVELAFRPDQALDRFWLDLGEGRTLPLAAGEGGWYRWQSVPTNSFELVAHAVNAYRLENKVKPATRLSVVEDRPPEVALVVPGGEEDDPEAEAVAPGQKLDVTFEARDDLGIAKAELQVRTRSASGATNAFSIPVDLGKDSGQPRIRRTVELDLAALGLKHGDALSYAVQVTDTRAAPARASGQEAREASARGAGRKEQQEQQANASDRDREAGSNPSDSKPTDPKERPDSQASPEKEMAQAATPGAAGKPSESRPAQGSPPPPNEMTRRTLDTGQCTTCQPRNLKVDEWAGKYDGERRKKLELEIAPVLRELDAALARAQAEAKALRAMVDGDGRLGEAARPRWTAGRGHIDGAMQRIAALRSRSDGTPYAFIGLQLHGIGEAHVVPAGRSLGMALGETSGAAIAALDPTDFHLARARERLADLTRTFETVKREQQVADAMQRLSKMYQVFLEDTQALLGGQKGAINRFDRKVAEVDEAFVEKLKALLEEKKKIMAELAKVLGDDPRLLRRYLAMMQGQGTSLRDQLTLLAEREKVVQAQVAEWLAAPETERPALAGRLRQHWAGQQRDAVEQAMRLRENLETWLPLDVKPDHPTVREALARAERIGAAMAEGATATNSVAGGRALAELRALREMLPGMGRLTTTNRPALAAYVGRRLTDVERLITAQSGWLRISEALGAGDFATAAEVVQHRLTQEIAALEEKLDASSAQLAAMSPEIAGRADELRKIVRDEILEPGVASVGDLGRREVAAAGAKVDAMVPAFERAEQVFDALLKLVIAKMDEAPPPTDPGAAPGLESMLAMLEKEMTASEDLGIPTRPINVAVLRDWMRPGSGQGQGMGQGQGQDQGAAPGQGQRPGQRQAQAQAARSEAEARKGEAERQERKARESARRAIADAKAEAGSDVATGAGAAPGQAEAWNKLASRLRKDLMQGRDNAPPEAYRDAIANYFKTLSGAGSEPKP